MSDTNLQDKTIINSNNTWFIAAKNVQSVDILEKNGMWHVLVPFRTGGDGPDGGNISADFEQCETLEEAEMKRAEILLKLEKINGHI